MSFVSSLSISIPTCPFLLDLRDDLFGLVASIRDPEHPFTLLELDIIRVDFIGIERFVSCFLDSNRNANFRNYVHVDYTACRGNERM